MSVYVDYHRTGYSLGKYTDDNSKMQQKGSKKPQQCRKKEELQCECTCYMQRNWQKEKTRNLKVLAQLRRVLTRNSSLNGQCCPNEIKNEINEIYVDSYVG